MRSLSPARKTSWSKHTSYPTAVQDRKFSPGEVGESARVNQRNAENEFDNKIAMMNNMRKKSLSQLDHQRKQLEKSMMAYTEKMREISESRTNELFREMHSRNTDRSDCHCLCEKRKHSIAESVSSDSTTSRRSLPIKLEKAAHSRRHSELRTLKGFSQVNVGSPILEQRENTTPEFRHSAHLLSRQKLLGYRSTENVSQLPEGLPRSKTNLSKDTSSFHQFVPKSPLVRKEDVRSISSARSESSAPSADRKDVGDQRFKVSPKVSLRKQIPWLVKDTIDSESSPDSAYSSCTDDLESISSSSANSYKSSKSSERIVCENGQLPETREEKMLLTVPKIHIRRGKVLKRKKTKRNQADGLFRKSVVNRVKHSYQKDCAVTNRTC